MDQWLPDLAGAELKVLLYLIRRTFGFHRNTVEVGLRRICNGVPGKDRGTGLHIETASSAVKDLTAKGIVISNREPGGRTTYTLPVSAGVYGKSERRCSDNPNSRVYGIPEHEERNPLSERKVKSSSPSPPTLDLERTRQAEEEERPIYATFKRLYPSQRYDEGKARSLFEGLPHAERVRVIERLRLYLVCPRWLVSLGEDNGRFIPFASNWLKSYDADPPPVFTKPGDETERRQVESISRVAELTRAYRGGMR
jgi:DNA-binding transcriptional ArsR family regulator